MARADFLRKNAEDCFAQAQQAPNDEARSSWLAMAQHWLQLGRDAAAGVTPGTRSPIIPDAGPPPPDKPAEG